MDWVDATVSLGWHAAKRVCRVAGAGDAGARAWREWLGEHHDESPGVWLVLAKKGTSEPTSLTYEQALEEALCHGWIDGQVGRRDEATYRQRFTPRRRRSAWSQRNAVIAERLLVEGRMRAVGIGEVERAQADGRWQVAYAGSVSIEVPPDLVEVLTAEPKAQAMSASAGKTAMRSSTGSRP